MDMLNEKDFWLIANHFRQEVQPRKIDSLRDVTKYPNDILVSYYLSDSPLGVLELADELKHPKEFNEMLGLYYPKDKREERLPYLGFGVDCDMHPHTVAVALKELTGKFSQGYDENKLIIATADADEYTYPSGRKVKYYRLKDEQSANISIMDSGYSCPDGIYIRDNFITMMLALNKVQMDNPEISQLQAKMKIFNKYIRGIAIAHELCEPEIASATDYRPRTLDLELETEAQALEFIQDQGIDKGFFELYHRLRANEDERGKNISALVLDHIL
jgi:hypothetical protein